jgi:hypothetical protein
MIRFLKANEEWLLAGVGLLLLAFLAACAVWAVTNISINLGAAMSAGTSNTAKIQFGLDQLGTLNLRGLNVSTSTSP